MFGLLFHLVNFGESIIFEERAKRLDVESIEILFGQRFGFDTVILLDILRRPINEWQSGAILFIHRIGSSSDYVKLSASNFCDGNFIHVLFLIFDDRITKLLL